MRKRILKYADILFEYFIIGLFCYAALAKLMHPFEFQVKLVKAAYIPVSIISEISIAVPVLELASVVLLSIKELNRFGWILVYVLMISFDGHLFILNWLSSSVPCSCGGLLEELTFSQHIILNIVITFLSARRVAMSG